MDNIDMHVGRGQPFNYITIYTATFGAAAAVAAGAATAASIRLISTVNQKNRAEKRQQFEKVWLKLPPGNASNTSMNVHSLVAFGCLSRRVDIIFKRSNSSLHPHLRPNSVFAFSAMISTFVPSSGMLIISVGGKSRGVRSARQCQLGS